MFDSESSEVVGIGINGKKEKFTKKRKKERQISGSKVT